MRKIVEKAYKFRCYPSDEQKLLLAKTFGCVRWIYNYFLNKKSQLWREEKKSLSYLESAKQLSELKKEYPWLKEVSSVCLQQALRHLDRAFKNFFSKKSRYPSFKKKFSRQSASFMQNAFTYREGELYPNRFKIRFLAKRKFPRLDDRKWPNIRNMRPLTIVQSRGFLKAKNPDFEPVWV